MNQSNDKRAETPSLQFESAIELSAAQATNRGLRSQNEDCMGMRIPEGDSLTLKGAAAVIADGVSSAEAGREAAESCVQSFLADYYSTPDAWGVKTSGQAVLSALNRWLYGRSHGVVQAHRGYVSTLSVLILKSRTAHVLHVGDTRIHRLREGVFEQLTTDHSTRITEDSAYLSRAMGMDVRLEVDYRQVELREGDVFLLTTDGVHDHLEPDVLGKLVSHGLAEGEALETLVGNLITHASEAGSDDNLTAQLIRVDRLAPDHSEELHRRLTRLPFPPPLEVGMKIDGYRVEKELHASSRSQVHLVIDIESGERMVMKTPSVNFDDDPGYIERFIMESWVGQRIESGHVVRIIESPRRPSFLYYLMEYVDGPSLRGWIDSHPDPAIGEVVRIVEEISAGLRAFHNRDTLHQDLKPENILFRSNGEAVIVDFGACRVAGIHEISLPVETEIPLGTARYSAPETRWLESAGIRSDLFSLGCIAYEMLTGQIPYGEAIESACTPRHFERLEYTPAYHHNPMVPVWLDATLRMACRVRAPNRYRALSEFIYDLGHPNPAFLRESPRPLVERDPLRFWKMVAGILGAGWIATLGFLLR